MSAASVPKEGFGLDFALSSDDQLFQKTVNEFSMRVLAKRGREIDEKQTIPLDILEEMGSLGLIGITIPKEYGGMGATLTQAVIAGIEIGRGDVSMATAVYYLLCAGWSGILAKYGTPECKKAVLPHVAAGKWFLGIATTEPSGGSDLSGIKTTAKIHGDEVVVHGEKMFISGGTEAAARGGGQGRQCLQDPQHGPDGNLDLHGRLRQREGAAILCARRPPQGIQLRDGWL
jgi:acyl-CoA dehydrogenase